MLAFCTAGCTESATTPSLNSGIEEPAVVETGIEAGETYTFPCDEPLIIPPLETGSAIERAGEYSWSCPDVLGKLVVAAGPPNQLTLEIPEDVVRLGATLRPQSILRDRFGNRVDKAEVALTASSLPEKTRSAGEARVSSGQVRFVASGWVKLSATYTTQSGETLTAEKPLYIDAGPPTVIITSPERGAIIGARTNGKIQVRGRIVEDGQLRELRVADNLVEVREDGRFDALVTLTRPGLHILTYDASDMAGHQVRGSRAFLYGPLRDARNPIANGLLLRLPSWFLDDNDPDVDDLATALKILTNSLEIPSQKISLGCNGTIRLKDVDFTVSNVDLTASSGALTVAAEIVDFGLAISGSVCACSFGLQVGCITADGTVKTKKVSADLTASVGVPTPTSLRPQEVNVALDPLSIHWGFLGGSLDFVVNLFEEKIREKVVSALEGALQEQLEKNLSALSSSVVPAQSLALPEPLNSTVSVGAKLVETRADEHGIGFSMQVETSELTDDGRSVPPKPSPTVRTSWQTPPLPKDKVAFALSLDVLNDLLNTLYRSGSLSEVSLVFDSLRMPPPPGVVGDVRISASLPPMLVPGKEEGSLELVVGDLLITVDTAIETVSLYVSFKVPVSLGANAQEGTIVVSPLPHQIEIFFEPATPEDAATLSAAFRDLESAIRYATILSLVGETISFPLPRVDLRKLPGITPEQAKPLALSELEFGVTPLGYIIGAGKLRIVED